MYSCGYSLTFIETNGRGWCISLVAERKSRTSSFEPIQYFFFSSHRRLLPITLVHVTVLVVTVSIVCQMAGLADQSVYEFSCPWELSLKCHPNRQCVVRVVAILIRGERRIWILMNFCLVWMAKRWMMQRVITRSVRFRFTRIDQSSSTLPIHFLSLPEWSDGYSWSLKPYDTSTVNDDSFCCRKSIYHSADECHKIVSSVSGKIIFIESL